MFIERLLEALDDVGLEAGFGSIADLARHLEGQPRVGTRALN
jgi:hypothetical protein